MMESRPNVGLFVAVDGKIIRHDGKVLMMKRKYSPNKGKWQFFGGRASLAEETLINCCRREVLEETGLIVEVGDIAHMYLVRFVGLDRIPTGKKTTIIVFNCRIIGGELDTEKLDEEAAAWGWFHPDEYPDDCTFDYSKDVESVFQLDRGEYGR